MSAVLREAAAGRASALLVTGEAGAGKTALVRSVCSQHDMIWATCLPLSTLVVPLLPLRSATAPAFPGRPPDWDATYPVLEVDAWLDRAASERLVVLVIDDVQWADQSSLDVLMYVLAGRADRRLAVIMTLREGEDAGRLRPWLADVRRFPRLASLTMSRLDRVATGEQIGDLLGRPPHQGLLDDVYTRSAGNPYLTSLLVNGLSPDATNLPAGLPGALRDALSRAWHGLSPAAREAAVVIAVGGRPQRVTALAALLNDVLPLLREGVDGGVLRVEPDGRYWFAHPLLAEVLIGELLPEERRAWHSAYASALDDHAADPSRAASLARHYEQAGLHAAAYTWALRAATLTTSGPESLRLLRTALALRPPDAAKSQADLLVRICQAAARDGRDTEELEATLELLPLLDPESLGHAMLLLRLSELKLATGRSFYDFDALQAALRVTARHPASREHALALATTAITFLYGQDPEGERVATAAIEAALAEGSAELRVYALIVDAMRRTDATAFAIAEQAYAGAAGLRLPHLMTEATFACSRSAPLAGSDKVVSLYDRCRDDLQAAGAAHNHVSLMCAWAAYVLLPAGRWDECTDRLRTALGSRPGPMGDVLARLVGAELACLRGRQAEAEAHLARAEEVFAETSGYMFFPFDKVRTRLAVAAGDKDRALVLVRHALGHDPIDLDSQWTLPLAARAIADQVRDCHVDPAPALRELEDLLHEFPRVPGSAESFEREVVDTRDHRACPKCQGLARCGCRACSRVRGNGVDLTGERSAGLCRDRADKCGDRRRTGAEREDDQRAHLQHAAQDRRGQPDRTGPVGPLAVTAPESATSSASPGRPRRPWRGP
ncbi:AAA ATPase-like protein [Paractinoplanes brasiliensis]|uniref:AAA ATPase-like protein n=1 Tax=Paractinoplanes brasiliensis TaxID=52695 RepID=A0A4V3C675_9ACTN|nr:AAA ATPase-like protein [Actinoplanes brasiliensis]